MPGCCYIGERQCLVGGGTANGAVRVSAVQVSKVLTRVRGIYYGWVLVPMLGVTQTITWGIVYYGFAVFLPAR